MWSHDICEHFGKRLRQLGTKRGLSQEDLAYRVGMDISYLSELENGKKEPCSRKMKELAYGLSVTLPRMVRAWTNSQKPFARRCGN